MTRDETLYNIAIYLLIFSLALWIGCKIPEPARAILQGVAGFASFTFMVLSYVKE